MLTPRVVSCKSKPHPIKVQSPRVSGPQFIFRSRLYFKPKRQHKRWQTGQCISANKELKKLVRRVMLLYISQYLAEKFLEHGRNGRGKHRQGEAPSDSPAQNNAHMDGGQGTSYALEPRDSHMIPMMQNMSSEARVAGAEMSDDTSTLNKQSAFYLLVVGW